MNEAERKTLEYLQYRDWIAIGAIIAECPDASENTLHSLRDKGLVEHKKYVGSGNTDFYRPTNKGKRALLPFCTNVENYIAEHWLSLLAIILALISLFKH